jgi:hypothetical protein
MRKESLGFDMSGTGPDQELFEAMAKLCRGRPLDHVLSAASNLLVNALRQEVMLRKEAEAIIDELFAKAKTLLIDQHYDPVTGKRRNVFPFTQTLEMPFHDGKSTNFHG